MFWKRLPTLPRESLDPGSRCYPRQVLPTAEAADDSPLRVKFCRSFSFCFHGSPAVMGSSAGSLFCFFNTHSLVAGALSPSIFTSPSSSTNIVFWASSLYIGDMSFAPPTCMMMPASLVSPTTAPALAPPLSSRSCHRIGAFAFRLRRVRIAVGPDVSSQRRGPRLVAPLNRSSPSVTRNFLCAPQLFAGLSLQLLSRALSFGSAAHTARRQDNDETRRDGACRRLKGRDAAVNAGIRITLVAVGEPAATAEGDGVPNRRRASRPAWPWTAWTRCRSLRLRTSLATEFAPEEGVFVCRGSSCRK